MVDVYIVVGDGAAGKSATVAALSGVRRYQKSWPIEFGKPKRIENFYVEIRSLQEGNRAGTPKEFVKRVKKSGSKFVLIALRNQAFNGQGGAQEYIDYFEAQAWNIRGVCEIATKKLPLKFSGDPVRKRVLPQPKTTANIRANQARKSWLFS